MKYIVLSFVLWFALIMSWSAESADGMYRIITFKNSVKEAMSGDENWKACGNYFAAAESTEGKIIYFTFEKRSAGKLSTVSAFSNVDGIIILIDDKIKTPVLDIIWSSRKMMMFLISMNSRDYKTGLPCLAKGISI